METTIKARVTIEMTHRRVTVDDDGLTVRAHIVPHNVFVMLHKLGWSQKDITAIVILNGEPLRLEEIHSTETMVFRRLSPLEALAAVA